MDIHISKSKLLNQQKIQITGSKSESNRLLLLQALYPQISINNLSNSDDTGIMQKALSSDSRDIDVHHAGTAMRFLAAYYASVEGKEVVLTGSSRMKERPIKILVNALRDLGADIGYLENEGYPPLLIKGGALTKSEVSLSANISSQYSSALLLIAASLKEGLKINLRGKVTSLPYIKMTLSLLTQIGVHSSFEDNSIRVHPVERDTLQPITIDVESDWSSASYFYSCLALSEVGTSLHLSILKENSLQGDACLADIYSSFGIETSFKGNGVVLKKVAKPVFDSRIDLHLEHAPDIAQTIAVTAFGLGIDCYLSGLHTLKIKETDRLVALKTELEKLGAEVAITDSTLTLVGTKTIRENIAISTYNDHRMAMAFAPLGLKVPINFENADVVSKSYPNFWQDLKSLGFEIK